MSRTEMKEKEDRKSEHAINLSQSMDSVKGQLMTYGSQIQEYLAKVDAKVENYKFSVEKTEGGLSIDCQFRATLQSNGS